MTTRSIYWTEPGTRNQVHRGTDYGPAVGPSWRPRCSCCCASVRASVWVVNGPAPPCWATENAPAGRRAIYGTFPQLGAPLIVANVFFLVVSKTTAPDFFATWGWRFPFLASAVLVLVGLYVRLQLVESNTFSRVKSEGHVASIPLAVTVRKHWRPLTLGTFNLLATYVIFYLLTAFLLTYGTAVESVDKARAAAEKAGKLFDPEKFTPGLGFAKDDFLVMLIIGVIFFGICVVISGPLAERPGRRRTLIGVSLSIAVYGALWVPLFGLGQFAGIMAGIIIGFILMGLTYGPMGPRRPRSSRLPCGPRPTGVRCWSASI